VTASITMLPEITARVRPPRALAVPYLLGYPLGEPGNRELQTRILRALLALALRSDVPVAESW
jgi:hypothetical protein